MVEDRITALEATAERFEERLRRLESGTDEAAASPFGAWPKFPGRADDGAAAPPVPPRLAAERRVDLEDFVGGRLLAWLGGAAVTVGLAFLLAVAISRGWLGEGARTLLAGAVSAGLLAVGARLRERRGRNDAALAAAAAGVAGLFGTLVVAGSVYHLVPTALALVGALGVGGAATALAIRWRAPVMGWLGLVGALLAPAAFGAVEHGAGVAYLAVAYGATVAVLIWQRWTALAFAAFALATPQWLFWLYEAAPATPVKALTLAGFGVLTTAAAIGFELRRREPGVRVAAVVLLVLDAVVLDAAGRSLLHADLWLVAVAVAHLVAGLAGTRRPRISRELTLTALGLGVILADVAFAALTSGIPLVLGWAAGAVGFSALVRRAGGTPANAVGLGALPRRGEERAADRAFALAGLGGHLLSALLNSLLIDAHGGGPEAVVAVAVVGAGAAVSARLATRWRVALDGLAMAALAYASTLALDGVALTLALAAQALALTQLARRRRDLVAGTGALAFATLAQAHALIVLAPASALLDGLDHPLPAAGGLLAAAIALLAAARAPFTAWRERTATAPTGDGGAAAWIDRISPGLHAGAAVTALYLASTEVVTYTGAAAQTSLSILWALVGVAALIAGLAADRADLRKGALALLALTAAKVFLYDLASLDSLARVGSLVGIGLLLLAGGFAWQRVRPRALPDLREAGADAR